MSRSHAETARSEARSEASLQPDLWDRLPLVAWGCFLLVLPHLPSQDGPAHLLTGASLVGWLREETLPRVLFELRPWFLTNWLSLLVLGGLQEIGLGPAWAEKTWLFVVAVPWVEAFARIRRRLGSPRVVTWWVLLIFQGWIARLGLWSFLVAVGLGLWVWSRRRDGHLEPIDHLAMLLALVAHPFGPLAFLGLSCLEDLLARRTTAWQSLIPHALLVGMVVLTGADGRPVVPAPEAPDVLARSLGPWVSALHPGAIPRLFWLATLAVGALVAWRVAPRAPERRVLAIAALGLALASCIGPTALGSGSVLRPRMALLAWVLVLLAVPWARSASQGWRRRLAVLQTGLFALALAPPALHSWQVATEQRAVLDTLPELAPDSLVTASSHSEGEHYKAWLYAPWLHLADRWVVEQGAWDPFTYPVQTEHFPLVARYWLGEPMVNYVHWRPSRVDLEGFASVLDAFCVLGAPPPSVEALEGRLAGPWSLASGETEHRCWQSQIALPLRERFRRPWPLTSRTPPTPVTLDPRLPSAFTLGTDPSHAHWPWRAFLREPDGRLRPAGPGTIHPDRGYFDSEGRVAIEHWQPPEAPRVVVLLSG